MDKSKVGPALLFGAAFIAWFTLIGPALDKKFGPTPQEIVETPEEQTTTPATDGEVTYLDVKKEVSDVKAEAETKADEVKKDLTAKVEAKVELLPEQRISTPKFDVVVDPQTGIKEVFLHDAKDQASSNVVMGDPVHSSLFLNGIAADWKYGTAVIKKSASEVSISRPVLNKNITVVQTISLNKNYQFKNTFKILNNGKEPMTFSGLGVNCGQMRPIAVGGAGMMAGMDQGVDFYDKESEKVTTEFLSDIISAADEAEEEQGLEKGTGKLYADKAEQGYQWIAVKNRYFAWIVDVEEGFDKVYMNYKPYKSIDEETKEPVDLQVVSAVGIFKDFVVKPGQVHEIELDCYAGPQKLEILSKLSHGKKGVMQLSLFMFFKVGWVGLISELMLRGLLLLYSWVGSYGIAIICLTIIIKTIFWRITNKSTESMKKMSSLSPKMKEINEKYGDNPQVKQQKIMELYREAGVNPLAGCLPLLLQMPVFIALFNALRGAIELRHSEFLWVNDLSLPDTVFSIFGLPIRPLAIAWAATMVIQQKLVPNSADETQKKVMMFMPVFMLFVCYGMPSGLTLYWTFSTLMSILQYYMSNKKAKKEEQKTASAVTG